jgi:hypothetical protein
LSNATRSEMPVSELISWLFRHVLDDACEISALSDCSEALDAKVDIRLSVDTIARLRPACTRLRLSLSAYMRIVLYGYYTQKLIFVQEGGRYTLVANHDQT